MGGKKQTVGYKYYFTLQMGLGRGPINEIAEIRVGDVTALDVPICLAESGQLVYIDKPNLFGGDKKEGGIQGPMYVYNGARDQELIEGPVVSDDGTPDEKNAVFQALAMKGKSLVLPDIRSMLGGDVPNFRGVVTCWFDGLVAAMNPYPKEWSFRIRRTTAGWWNSNPWYPAKATINLYSEAGKLIRAMNGAHILYEVNTNPEWGRGMPAELIDENSYIRAANQLCEEGFGLCLPWFRQETIKEFIPVVIDHIGAAQYVDRETGKMTLRLIRGDYDVDDLPLFTPDTGLIDIIDDDASGDDTTYNEIVVNGYDPTTKEAISQRVQNLGSIQSNEEIISNTIEYKGLPTRELVGRVAIRELKVQTPLRKMTVRLDRRGWRIAPGMPFRISFPSRNIQNMIVRAGEVTDGNLEDGEIQVKVVQDIFGMPATSYVTPTPPVWTPPSFDAVPSPESRLLEINYRSFYRVSDESERNTVQEGTSYVAEVAKAPSGVQTQGYDLITRTGEGYNLDNAINGGFTAWLNLAADIGPLDDTLEIGEENQAYFALEFRIGMVVQIDEEQIAVVSTSSEDGSFTLKRGVADTIPAPHSAGATIWLIDDEMVSDGIEYQDGETIYAKALTRTTTDVLEQELAPEDEVTVNQRVYRPYPPGDVKQGGNTVYATRSHEIEPVLTWTHRDRLVQADQAIGHLEGSVGPEPGTTYTVRVYDQIGDTLLNTYDGIDATTWTYTTAMQAADGAPMAVWMELESNRDGLSSHFFYRFYVVIVGGWGYGWGDNWGGS